MLKTALLVIAHGSRKAAANADTDWVVGALRRRGEFDLVEQAFLELAPPDIDTGAATCVTRGARRVILLPYFLSAGVHVRRDLTEARQRLAKRHPDVEFLLAEPLGRSEKLVDLLMERAAKSLSRPRRRNSSWKVFYLHWNANELRQRAAMLENEGYQVSGHSSSETLPLLKESLPDAAVMSLDRLPSHTRAVAEWLWEAKKRRHIPIVFAGGEPAKVAAIKVKFPGAHFCAVEEVSAVLARLKAAPQEPKTGQLRKPRTRRKK